VNARFAATGTPPWTVARRAVADGTGSGGATDTTASPDPVSSGPVSSAPVSANCEIVNQRGLHARAAARFVKTVDRFDATVKVFSRGQEVSGHSIMGLMMLAAGTGTVIRIVCEGPQAQEVLDAVRTLIADRFDED